MPAIKTFTVFCHGTASHRTRTDGEIVAEFGKAAAGEEYENYLILDGPGSGADEGMGSVDDPDNPMPGLYNPFTRDKLLKSTPEDEEALGYRGRKKRFLRRKLHLRKNAEMGYSPSPGSGTILNDEWAGKIKGTGWEDNVTHAGAVIGNLVLDNPSSINTVNLIGWSRGAVTCLKIANRLYDFFPQITVNIFAVDPVSGGGSTEDIREGGKKSGKKLGKDIEVIPPNVHNYVATLAMHEQRRGFEPQDLHLVNVIDPKKTEFVLLPFPGKHNTQVKIKAADPKEVAELVWFLAQKFLKFHGTKFNNNPAAPKTLHQVLLLYQKIGEDMARYEALRQRIYRIGEAVQGGIHRRKFREHMSDYASFEAFINSHHQMCLRQWNPAGYEKMRQELSKGRSWRHPLRTRLWKSHRFEKVLWGQLGLALSP